jgi:hypothetical protein
MLSKCWFWLLIRGMMRSLEVSRTAINSSQSMRLGWFVCGFCWLAFHERVPWFLGTPKNCNSPLKLWGELYKRGLWFFVRLLKQSLGEVDMCCHPVFMFCQVEGWCQEHWIVWSVGVEGFMSPNVNVNLSSRGSPMWS